VTNFHKLFPAKYGLARAEDTIGNARYIDELWRTLMFAWLQHHSPKGILEKANSRLFRLHRVSPVPREIAASDPNLAPVVVKGEARRGSEALRFKLVGRSSTPLSRQAGTLVELRRGSLGSRLKALGLAQNR
jgi:hypothetical protein